MANEIIRVILPNHLHGDDDSGFEHSHDQGHVGHSHPAEGNEPRIPSAKGGQYERPVALVTIATTLGRSTDSSPPVQIVCSQVVWRGSYLQYVPAKGFEYVYVHLPKGPGDVQRMSDGRTSHVVSPDRIISIENLVAP